MRDTLAAFAPQPYTDETVALLRTRSRPGIYRTPHALNYFLPPAGRFDGAVHVVMARALELGHFHPAPPGMPEQYAATAPGRPVLPMHVPVRHPTHGELRADVSGWAGWGTWADGSWWLLATALDDRPGQHASVPRVAQGTARAWARHHGFRLDRVILPPDSPGNPAPGARWLVRFRPRV